jgi:predicted PurR-regulated permease PerM
LPENLWKQLEEKAKEFAENYLPALLSSVLGMLQSLSFQGLMFVLYLMFWICEPLPISNSVSGVFKSYLLLKTIVCGLFAGLMSLVLWVLKCKFWHIYFVTTFFLNYIPEIGPLFAGLLMLPAVLFDGNLSLQERQQNTVWLLVAGTFIKIVTGNVIELQLYSSRGGEFMRMHPVVLLALMMVCECLLGVTGMFLAIPVLAAVKYLMVTTDMPSVYLNPLLVFIEGDQMGPHKIFVDRRAAETAAKETGTRSRRSWPLSRSFSTRGASAELAPMPNGPHARLMEDV